MMWCMITAWMISFPIATFYLRVDRIIRMADMVSRKPSYICPYSGEKQQLMHCSAEYISSYHNAASIGYT